MPLLSQAAKTLLLNFALFPQYDYQYDGAPARIYAVKIKEFRLEHDASPNEQCKTRMITNYEYYEDDTVWEHFLSNLNVIHLRNGERFLLSAIEPLLAHGANLNCRIKRQEVSNDKPTYTTIEQYRKQNSLVEESVLSQRFLARLWGDEKMENLLRQVPAEKKSLAADLTVNVLESH